jgi:hypothetical protein
MIAIRKFRMCGMSVAIAAVTVLSACGDNMEPSGSQPPPVSESPSTSVPPASVDPSEQDKIMETFVQRASSDVSADQLLNQLVESLGKVDPEQADAMLRAMDAYYSRNLPKIEEIFYPDDVQKELSVLKFPITEDQFANIQDPEVRSLVQQTLDGGYKLDMAEGVVFPVIGYVELKALADGASDAMQDYLDLMAVESEDRMVRDAALVISRDELARRTLTAEAFIREHADAPELQKVKNQYMIYIRSYLFGLDNTPNTEDDFKFKPEFRSEMEKLVAENTGTATADLVGQLLEILDSTGGYLFRKDPEVYQKDIPEVRAFMDSLEVRAGQALAAQ